MSLQCHEESIRVALWLESGRVLYCSKPFSSSERLAIRASLLIKNSNVN